MHILTCSKLYTHFQAQYSKANHCKKLTEHATSTALNNNKHLKKQKTKKFYFEQEVLLRSKGANLVSHVVGDDDDVATIREFWGL